MNTFHCRLVKTLFLYCLVEYLELLSNGDGLRPAFHIQLGIDIGYMTLYSRGGDDQLPGDILVGTTGFNELKHFHLTPGQRLAQQLHGGLSHSGDFANLGQQHGRIIAPDPTGLDLAK